MKRLYITGGTGLVGSNILRLARARRDIEIIAAQYGPEPEWDVDYELDPLDMTDTAAVAESIHRYQPDVVIHCAAILDQVYMNDHRADAWRATVDSNRAFAHSSAEVDARYIFISSNWVFDGQQPLVDEDSPPFPLQLYGYMKAICERDIMGGGRVELWHWASIGRLWVELQQSESGSYGERTGIRVGKLPG